MTLCATCGNKKRGGNCNARTHAWVEERDKIVRYLRREASQRRPEIETILLNHARSIERGEHDKINAG